MPKGSRRNTGSASGHSAAAPELPGDLQYLPLDQLDFDPKNPRIVERLGENPTQSQIEARLLGTEMKARELVPSFIENGYIPYEPLIVRPQDETFVVIEGNRRLAALRSMVKSGDPDEQQAVQRHRLDSVPCLIFSGDEKQLLAYLGLRHLSKTKDWSTSAKGAFVERVLREKIDIREAARLTNTTTNNLRLILLTRRLFDQARVLGLDLTSTGAEGETIFWHLGDAVRRTRTKTYLKLEESPDPLQSPSFDQTKFENLIGWLFGNTKTRQQRIIGSIRNIGDLDLCLGDDRATRALENGASLTEAQEELEAAGATIVGHLDRARRSVERASGGPWPELDLPGLQSVEIAASQLKAAVDQLTTLIAHYRSRVLPQGDQQ
jgi:ParB-like chromosome segregation protein Spo0J